MLSDSLLESQGATIHTMSCQTACHAAGEAAARHLQALQRTATNDSVSSYDGLLHGASGELLSAVDLPRDRSPGDVPLSRAPGSAAGLSAGGSIVLMARSLSADYNVGL